ncbi:MAG: threonine/serine exporter family protein [Lachnospiraceae bacterium]|nr:threonine/serine exporter family protein [Lachnospiraceae bacterium]
MNETMIGNALEIGKYMLKSGGEVSRVEDTMSRILRAYGFVRVDVFTITSQIQITAEDSTGKIHHQFRRVYRWGTNLEELERLNQISRTICAEKPDPGEIPAMIHAPDSAKCRKETKADKLTAYAGAVLAASGFTVFFGGGAADAVITAVLALLITRLNRHSNSSMESQLLLYFFFAIEAGFAGSFLVMLGDAAGLPMDLDKILIGCIMLTIPGISITYSVRDMLLGETITGLLRFVESLLIAASIAAGYVLASFILGGVW